MFIHWQYWGEGDSLSDYAIVGHPLDHDFNADQWHTEFGANARFVWDDSDDFWYTYLQG